MVDRFLANDDYVHVLMLISVCSANARVVPWELSGDGQVDSPGRHAQSGPFSTTEPLSTSNGNCTGLAQIARLGPTL